MEPSAALEAKIRERTDELERFHDRITGCHVVVEAVQSRHQQGNLYHTLSHHAGGDRQGAVQAGQYHAH